MNADFETSVATAFHGIKERLVVVPSIHPLQGLIVDGLGAILDREVGAARDFLEQIQHVVGNAIGTGPNGHGDDLGVGQCRFVNFPQPLDRRVGVGGRLEIGHEMVARITAFQPPDTLVDLVKNFLLRQPATGTKTAVITKSATTDRNRSIDIWAGETGIDADLLDAVPKSVA